MQLLPLLVLVLCGIMAVPVVLANQNTTTSLQPVLDPRSVVQRIVMGPGSANTVMPEVNNKFLPKLQVRRKFDDVEVKNKDVGQYLKVKVKSGRKRILYRYGVFMIMRVRSITNEFFTSICAPPSAGTTLDLTLKHEMSNTKVASVSTTKGWTAEAKATAKAEAAIPMFGFPVSIGQEMSSTVRRSVSTTYSSSRSEIVTVSSERKFKLEAPPGKEAALWVSTTQLDVYVCKPPRLLKAQNPIHTECTFTHSVTESGKRFEVTVTD